MMDLLLIALHFFIEPIIPIEKQKSNCWQLSLLLIY